VTFLTERLADLRRHVDHLRALRSRVSDAERLRGDLSLHNDVMFSLLQVAQLVIDISGELAARHGIRFETYGQAVRALDRVPGFAPDLVSALARLPGFRNIVIHDYLDVDYDLVVAALDELGPIDHFIEIVARIESDGAL
jgi:uncharacterized protein YutE (UPF0331/DUF86 family)